MDISTNTLILPKTASRLQIVPGSIGDYKKLARWHYRDNNCGPYVAIYSLRQPADYPGTNANWLVGVIVYTMPTTGCTARENATGRYFIGLSMSDRIALLNRHFRRISRVIIEPRYRGCGLASMLVNKTMPLLNVTYIEAMAAMGNFNPFFEKAGMTPYPQAIPKRTKMLLEALSIVGIEQATLNDAQAVQQKLAQLDRDDRTFIYKHICRFTGAFGKSRMQSYSFESGILNLKSVSWILSKLSLPPVYYIWINQNTKCERCEK
jgi:hypothetical protein